MRQVTVRVDAVKRRRMLRAAEVAAMTGTVRLQHDATSGLYRVSNADGTVGWLRAADAGRLIASLEAEGNAMFTGDLAPGELPWISESEIASNRRELDEACASNPALAARVGKLRTS